MARKTGYDYFRQKNDEWQAEKERRLKLMIESGELKPRMISGHVRPIYGNGYYSPSKVVAQRMRREREKAGLVKTNIFVGDRPAWERDQERILKPVTEIKYSPARATPLKVYKLDEGIDWEDKGRTLYKASAETKPVAELPKILPIQSQECQNPRNVCRDCRDIFSDICRFNRTQSFWKANA